MKILFLIVFFDLLGFGLILPSFPFLAEGLGASPMMVTWAMGAYSLGQFVAAPVLGRLSDRYGRRPVLLFSLAGAFASYLLLALAESYAMIVLARILGGVTAGNIAVAFAYVADVTRPEERAKSMGMMAAALSLGFILGPVIGGVLAGSDPAAVKFDTIAGVAMALAALAFVLTAWKLPESRTSAERKAALGSALGGVHAVLASLVLLALVGLNFLVTGAGAMLETTFVLWADRVLAFGPAEAGALFGYTAVITTLVQAFGIGPLRKHFGEAPLLSAAVALYAAGMFTMTLAGGLAVTMLAMGLIGVGMAIFNPCASSLVSQSAAAADRGAVMGLFQSAGSLGRVIGPAVSGPLFQFAGAQAPFAAGALLTAPAAVIVLLVMRRSRALPRTSP